MRTRLHAAGYEARVERGVLRNLLFSRSFGPRHVYITVRSTRVIGLRASPKPRGNAVILRPELRRGLANSFTRKPAEVVPGELCEQSALLLAFSMPTRRLGKASKGKEQIGICDAL